MNPTFFDECFEKEIAKCVQIGLLCVQELPNDRPNVSNVIWMLTTENANLPEAKQLLELYHSWRISSSLDERRSIWGRMLALFTDQVFTIGTVNGVLQPVVTRKTLRNLPEKGVYSFAPGAYFGMYMIDTLWFDEKDGAG